MDKRDSGDMIMTMMAGFLFLLLVGMIALIAFFDPPGQPTGRLVGFEARPVTIVGVNSPKHFSVDVLLGDGRVLRGVARSKHCNGWRKTAVVGRSYTVPFRIRRQANGSHTATMDGNALNEVLCP